MAIQSRLWRKIAAKASREQDPEKLLHLTEELLKLLDERKSQIEKPSQKA